MINEDVKTPSLTIQITKEDAKEFIKNDDGSEFAETSYVKLILPKKYLIQLKVIMLRDRISKYKLIKELINGYLENDPHIRSFINKRFNTRYTTAENLSRSKEEKAIETREKLLDDVDIVSIYDELDGDVL